MKPASCKLHKSIVLNTTYPGMIRTLLTAMLLVASVPAQSLAADEVGHIVVLKGEAIARQPDGTILQLSRRNPILVGQRLITDPDSSLQILLDDDTQFVLREESEFMLEAYDENTLNLKPGKVLIMSLFRGCIRYMTGEIGVSPRDDVRLDTQFASLQIDELVVFETCIDEQRLETAVSAGTLLVTNQLGNLQLDFSGQFDYAETIAGQSPTGSRVQPMPAPPPRSTGPVRLRQQEDFDIIPLDKAEE